MSLTGQSPRDIQSVPVKSASGLEQSTIGKDQGSCDQLLYAVCMILPAV